MVVDRRLRSLAAGDGGMVGLHPARASVGDSPEERPPHQLHGPEAPGVRPNGLTTLLNTCYNGAMMPSAKVFQRSIDQQIAMNQARNPSQRFEALCTLMDAARTLAPTGVEAENRRHLAEAARQLDRERWRDKCRQFLATQRADAWTGT